MKKKRLGSLPRKKLIAIKKAINKYLYANSVNINLYNALDKSEVQVFKKKLEKALLRQINHIARVEKIARISQVLGKVDRNILREIGLMWLYLGDVLDGGQGRFEEFILWAGQQGGQAALDKMVPDHRFNLKSVDVEVQLRSKVGRTLELIDNTTKKWVAGLVEKGLKEKLKFDDIAALIKAEAAEMADRRAGVITETELHQAMTAVEVITYSRNGVKKHRWVTAHDEKVEQRCMENEAVGVIEVGAVFPSGVVAPPAHIFCRCFLLPVLPTVIEGRVWTGG